VFFCVDPFCDGTTKLRQVDVLNAQGKSMAEAIRSKGVTEVTYYRWRSEHGGLKGDQVKRLKNWRPRTLASAGQFPI
jgi:hypothetical protein